MTVIVLLLLLFLHCCSGATLWASPRGGANKTSCAQPSPCSLAAAVDGAKDGDVLMLFPGNYTGPFPMDLTKSLSFVGSSGAVAWLDAGGQSRIFTVVNTNVSLASLSLVNGLRDSGGAIYARGAYLTIDECTFVNNTADSTLANAGGGAIYLNNSSVSITNSRFVNNVAGTIGGAVAVLHNRTDNLAGPITCTHSLFLNNTILAARGALGSAISVVFDLITFNDTRVLLRENQFTNNTSIGLQGDTVGAVSVLHVKQAQRNTVATLGNVFDGNTARVMEGQCLGGALGVVYRQVSINETVYATRDKYVRSTCWATQQGSAFGGALSVWFNGDSSGARVSLNTVTYSENNATALDSAIGGGACIFNNGQSAGLTVSDVGSLYLKNVAVSEGEGSCLGGGLGLFVNDAAVATHLLISGSAFYNNSIKTTYSQEGHSLGGGASVFLNSQLKLVNVTVTGIVARFNLAVDDGSEGKSYGGGLSVFLNEYQNENPGVSVVGCNIANNSATVCSNSFTSSAVCT